MQAGPPRHEEPRLAAGWDDGQCRLSPEPGFHLCLDHDLVCRCSIRLGGRKTCLTPRPSIPVPTRGGQGPLLFSSHALPPWQGPAATKPSPAPPKCFGEAGRFLVGEKFKSITCLGNISPADVSIKMMSPPRAAVWVTLAARRLACV